MQMSPARTSQPGMRWLVVARARAVGFRGTELRIRKGGWIAAASHRRFGPAAAAVRSDKPNQSPFHSDLIVWPLGFLAQRVGHRADGPVPRLPTVRRELLAQTSNRIPVTARRGMDELVDALCESGRVGGYPLLVRGHGACQIRQIGGARTVRHKVSAKYETWWR